MGTKLRLALKLLTAEQYAVVTYKNGKISPEGGGRAEMAGMMAMAIAFIRMSQNLTTGIEEIAAEEGELKTYLELRKTLDAIKAE